MATFDEAVSVLQTQKDNRLEFINSAVEVAKSAGRIISEAYYKLKNVSGKSEATDLVTATDVEVEKFIFDSLKRKFPSHSFIGEESVADGQSSKLTSNPTWIVDPIDGTANFVHTFQFIAVSIGLVIDKKSEVGVVFAPIMEDLYVAVRGVGAFLNNKRLKIENLASSLSTACVASEWGAYRDPDRVSKTGKNMIDVVNKHKIHAMRSTGSAALNMCLVARGSFDLYYEWGPHCWDMAAGYLLVEEAGGVNSTTTGAPFDLMGRTVICASSRKLIDEILPTLSQVETPRDDDE